MIRRFFPVFPAAACLLLTGCQNTSLSNPGGSGHRGDLDIYELTGDDPKREVSERDIQAAASGRTGTLPARGARILLVQSGAMQPDAELTAAFKPYGQVIPWDGRDNPNGNPNRETSYHSGERKAESSNAPRGAAGRRLRLVAAQQGCSHVIVIFGEIQSASRELATGTLAGWVPIVGNVVPGNVSGTRLLAQAIVMETARPRYSLVAAEPQEARGITTEAGQDSINVRRALRLKKAAYPELAAKSFRQ